MHLHFFPELEGYEIYPGPVTDLGPQCNITNYMTTRTVTLLNVIPGRSSRETQCSLRMAF
jgi:hypothetical protein